MATAVGAPLSSDEQAKLDKFLAERGDEPEPGSDDEYELDADGFYDQVEIEDMDFDEETRTYYYPCPCGDKFFIREADMFDGEYIGRCPSCSLKIRVIYNPEDFVPSDEES